MRRAAVSCMADIAGPCPSHSPHASSGPSMSETCIHRTQAADHPCQILSDPLDFRRKTNRQIRSFKMCATTNSRNTQAIPLHYKGACRRMSCMHASNTRTHYSFNIQSLSLSLGCPSRARLIVQCQPAQIYTCACIIIPNATRNRPRRRFSPADSYALSRLRCPVPAAAHK